MSAGGDPLFFLLLRFKTHLAASLATRAATMPPLYSDPNAFRVYANQSTTSATSTVARRAVRHDLNFPNGQL